MIRRLRPVTSLLLFALAAAAAHAQTRRMVIIDQDGSGPGGSNQMAMMVLLQSPQAEVLGITMVSGNAWEPEEVQHTLRMLELIHRPDVPVVPGAIFPLVQHGRGGKAPAAALRRIFLVWGVGRSCRQYQPAAVSRALCCSQTGRGRAYAEAFG